MLRSILGRAVCAAVLQVLKTTVLLFLASALVLAQNARAGSIEVQQITNYSGYSGSYSLGQPYTDDGKVVWTAINPWGTFPQVYMYDWQTGVTTQVTNYGSGGGSVGSPQIADGIITWLANPPGGTGENVFMATIPEPATAMLVLVGGFAAVVRRRTA